MSCLKSNTLKCALLTLIITIVRFNITIHYATLQSPLPSPFLNICKTLPPRGSMLLNVSQRGLILLSITLHFSGLHVEINENIQEYTEIYKDTQNIKLIAFTLLSINNRNM